MAWVPAHQVVGDPAARRWAFVLHGILGSGQNLRVLARRLAQELPEWAFVLVDLRNHGESRGAAAPHTLAACAADLEAVADVLPRRPTVAIGHSFGGKVALVWGAAAEAAGRRVDAVWALDVPPGTPDGPIEGTSEVVRVVRALRAVQTPLPRRDSIVAILVDKGFSPALAQWMTTNLRATDAGFVWRFDLDAVEAMLRDYAATSAWPWLEDPARRARVDVLRGGRSDRWSDAELARFVGPPRLALHLLPDAGHWVHVDDPDGLLRVLVAGLRPLAGGDAPT